MVEVTANVLRKKLPEVVFLKRSVGLMGKDTGIYFTLRNSIKLLVIVIIILIPLSHFHHKSEAGLFCSSISSAHKRHSIHIH